MISVIVPAYNLERYIVRALDSILVQTYNNIEIIVVDDGSTDNTAEVIDRYAGDYPEKIRAIHVPNGGVTNARLTGVMQAKGEWIGFVDGDDEIEKDMYEFLLNNALKYHAQISHCGYQMNFPDGRVSYFYNTGCLVEQDKITALKELLSGSRIEPGLCNKLFHKSLFHGLLHENLMDSSIQINEDLLMNYYLFSSAKSSTYEDRCPYHYMVRYTSASRQSLNEHKIYDPIKVKRIILDSSQSEIKESAQKAYLSTCINVYNSLICANGREYKEDRKKVRKLLMEKKNWIGLLNRRTKILASLIQYVPRLYPLIYGVYVKCLQKKKYE